MHKTTDKKLLLDVKKNVSQCDRCGTCLTVCPLFEASSVETSSARGKNVIARALAEGGIDPTRDVLAAVNFCLLCRACVEACPNKIETDEAMLNVRQYIINRTGGPSVKYKAIGSFLGSCGMVKVAAAMLSIARKLNLNNIFPNGMVPEEYTRAHFLTTFAGPAALGQSVPPSDVAVTAKTKVAYFRGCGMWMMFPQASAETVKILKTTTPLILKNNVCCGLPHLAHGLRGKFLALAKKNIELYEDAEVVVSDCASCGGTLKHIASYFNEDPEWKDLAAAFSHKVMDLAEYLIKVGYTPRQKLEATFTYHDPCHLVRGQGIKKQPRDLLKTTGKFIEMKEADMCCSGAGTFHMDYPEISLKIVEKKRQNIERTGAAIVVTSCPGCLIQLTKAAKLNGSKFKPMHISQVI